jgi:hypothetical protein
MDRGDVSPASFPTAKEEKSSAPLLPQKIPMVPTSKGDNRDFLFLKIHPVHFAFSFIYRT